MGSLPNASLVFDARVVIQLRDRREESNFPTSNIREKHALHLFATVSLRKYPDRDLGCRKESYFPVFVASETNATCQQNKHCPHSRPGS